MMSTPNRPTQLRDNNGVVIPHTATDDIMNISKFGTANIVIVAYARPGSTDAEARWKIYFNTYDASGNIVRMRLANGKNDYNSVWTSKTGTAITGASQADPCVITSNDHGLVTGDFIETDSMAVGGMVELNSDGYGNKVFHVTKINANTFSLQQATDPTTNIDSSGYAAYTAGGKFYKHEHLQDTWS